jgi:Tfp pilus assembly pilus retraction ATPase PilT
MWVKKIFHKIQTIADIITKKLQKKNKKKKITVKKILNKIQTITDIITKKKYNNNKKTITNIIPSSFHKQLQQYLPFVQIDNCVDRIS